MDKKPLIILTGPTAVGKTDLSIALGKCINGAMISADSMQVYKRMDIGTAKIKKEEMQGIDHYLVDILEPEEPFDVTLFQKYANEALEQIYADGKIPVVVGGTGFYIQALLYQIEFGNEHKDSEYRTYLEQYVEEHGNIALHNLLKEKDEKAALAIHPNNVRRVIRALEFFEETGGQKISDHNEEQSAKESPFNFAYFVLNNDRDILYKRIDARVDLMIEEGLVSEVSALLDAGLSKDAVSMQGLGYKEIADYLCGECSLDDAIYRLKRDTRHFAKRQITWFKREKDVIWLDKSKYSEDEILNQMVCILKDKKILK